MFKKLLLYGGIGGLVAFLLFGTAAFTHLSNGVAWVRGQVEESVPVEMELERARALIEDTRPQILDCKRVIAEKQVEIRHTRASLADLEAQYSRNVATLQQYRGMLDTEQASYGTRRGHVSRRAVEARAARLFARVKAQKAMIESKHQRLSALEQSLEYAQKTLENVLTQRERLDALVDTLETKLRQTEAMNAAANNIDVDDSNLSKAKEILMRCEKRLEVAQQMIVNDEPLIDAGSSLDNELLGDDIKDQISRWLDDGGPSEAPEASGGAEALTIVPAIER